MSNPSPWRHGVQISASREPWTETKSPLTLTSSIMVRNILIFGATGKQGSATVRQLLATTTSPPDFHVWAMTRNALSPAATKLVSDIDKGGSADRLTLIEGDLDNAESTRTAFDTVAEAEGGLWGVFLVLAFPGLGVNDNRERDHGIVIGPTTPQYWTKQRADAVTRWWPTWHCNTAPRFSSIRARCSRLRIQSEPSSIRG